MLIFLECVELGDANRTLTSIIKSTKDCRKQRKISRPIGQGTTSEFFWVQEVKTFPGSPSAACFRTLVCKLRSRAESPKALHIASREKKRETSSGGNSEQEHELA